MIFSQQWHLKQQWLNSELCINSCPEWFHHKWTGPSLSVHTYCVSMDFTSWPYMQMNTGTNGHNVLYTKNELSHKQEQISHIKFAELTKKAHQVKNILSTVLHKVYKDSPEQLNKTAIFKGSLGTLYMGNKVPYIGFCLVYLENLTCLPWKNKQTKQRVVCCSSFRVSGDWITQYRCCWRCEQGRRW